MTELFVTSERVKTRADLPDPLVPGRKYFIEDEGVVLVDWGEGAYQFGGGTGGGGVVDDLIVDSLIGNEPDKAPSVRVVAEELNKRPKLDYEGKIPEDLLPESVMKEALYRGPFKDPEALKAAHATDEPGAYASVISTNTLWMWDGTEWADTGKDLGVVNVVDTLENNEIDKAPSVRAVRELYKNKADLTIDGKIPVAQIPDAVTEKVVVDTLDGAETEKAPSVRAVNAALDKKANVDGNGKIPEEQLPDRIINDSLYRGAFATADALKAAHAVDIVGAYASVMATKTMWLWDGAAWTNTGNALTGVSVSVVDGLSSSSTKDALSANQGRILSGMFNAKADEASVATRLSKKSDVGHTHSLTLEDWIGVTGLTMAQLNLLKTLTPTMDDAGKYVQIVKGDNGNLKFAFFGVPKPTQYAVFNTDGIWIPPEGATNIKFTIVGAGGGGGAYYDSYTSDRYLEYNKICMKKYGRKIKFGVPGGGSTLGYIYRMGGIVSEGLLDKTEVHVVVGKGGDAGVDGGQGGLGGNGSSMGGRGGTTGVYVREYTKGDGGYFTYNYLVGGGFGGKWGWFTGDNFQVHYDPVDGKPGYVPNMTNDYAIGKTTGVEGTGLGGKLPVLMMPNGMSLADYGDGGDAWKKGEDGIVVIEYTL